MNTKRNENDDILDFFIPKDVPNYNLPDPVLLRKYTDIKDRIWWVDGEIEYTDIIELVKFIQAINREDRDIDADNRKPIRICIFSNGGDLVATYMLIDVMKASKTPIYTINMGEALSAAAVILMCGNKRFAMKHSRSLIHSGSGGLQGDFDKMEAAMDDYKALVGQLKDIVMSNTTIPANVYSKKRSKDWYQNSEDQLKFGIVDAIVESLDEIQ